MKKLGYMLVILMLAKIQGIEMVVDLEDAQPQYLYFQPQIIYEVTENPLYYLLDGKCATPEGCSVYSLDDEQPRFFYTNPKIVYQCQENPLYYLSKNSTCSPCEVECQEPQSSCCICQPYSEVSETIDRWGRWPRLSKYEVWADALYWHPLFDGVEYATVLGNPSVVQEVMPHFTWGYRIGGQVFANCDRYFVKYEYYSYHQVGSNSVSAPGAVVPFFQIPLAPNADAAQAELMSHYRAWDLTAGFRWLSSCRWKSSLFAGVRYVKIKEEEMFIYIDGAVITPAMQDYGFKGAGPEIGANFTIFPFSRCLRYFFIDNLGFFGQCALLGMIGETSLSAQSAPNVFLAPEGSLVFPQGEEFIVGLDLQLEVFYSLCIKAFNVKIRGGYQLHSYQNARQRLTSSNQVGAEPKTVSTLGFGGPYVGMSISY